MRKYSSSSIVMCWLLLVTQHARLFNALKAATGNRLDAHLCDLATHVIALLEEGVIDPRAAERAKLAHWAVGAFKNDKVDMAVFILDMFALVAKGAGRPENAAVTAIQRLIEAHGTPKTETATSQSRVNRAAGTLTHLADSFAVTGNEGVDKVMGLAESVGGQEALRLKVSWRKLVDECVRLLGRIENDVASTGAKDLVQAVKTMTSR